MRRTGLLAAMGLSVVCLVARADEGTVLRYKWVEGQQTGLAVAVTTVGKMTVTSAQGTQQQNVDVQSSMPMFSLVEKITPEGWARTKISFGLISFDTVTPDGKAIHGEMNPADGKMVITVGGERQEMDMPGGSVDLLSKGFTLVVDDRGQVKEFPDAERMGIAVAGMPGGGGTNLGQLATGMDPFLPEQAVKPGDMWEAEVPTGMMLGQPSAKPMVMKIKYVGDEQVDDVPCRHLSATTRVTGLKLSIPPALAGGMRTDISGFSVDATMDYYLSMDDLHTILAKVVAAQSGIVHVTGTTKGPNGEDVEVDQTVVLDGVKTTAEMKRM